MVYGYDFTDIEQKFLCFYIDAHDETENFVNLKGISNDGIATVEGGRRNFQEE